MKARHNLARLIVTGLAIASLAGCATYDRRANNTLLGAGLGTAAGAVVSGGDPVYMLGGAAAGGLLGNVLTGNDRSYRDRGWSRGDNYRHQNRRDYRRGHDRDDHHWNRRHNDDN